MFIRTIPPQEATGLLKDLYERDLGKHGFVPDWSRAFSLRPEALRAWRDLLGGIKARMDARRYELVTLVAAARLRCAY